MTRAMHFICLNALLCTTAMLTPLVLAQADSPATSAGSRVALVYVSSTSGNSNVNHIEAFAADREGRLRPVAGSPFSADVTSMAVNGKYLFGANRNGIYIDSYYIENNGALTYAASVDATRFNGADCGSTGPLFLDHTGASLYNLEFNGDGCANNVYQSYRVEKAHGNLRYLGKAQGGAESFSAIYLPAAFTGNNRFAYTATNDNCMYFTIWGFRRESSGRLVNLNMNAPLPAPPAGYRIYVPSQAAADPANHVAFTLTAANPPGCTAGVHPQLASYTVAANGDLSTTNTSRDMPRTEVTSVNDLKMSPSGKLLAVAGIGGLQIFHFDGAKPITRYTGLLTKDTIAQMFWDNDNHLYAISQTSEKLFVFTVTPSAHSQAPGSPRSISSPGNLIVQPWPRY